MFHTRFISVLATILVVGAQGFLDAPIPGYGIDPISWEVEISPGGSTVVLNGTVQQVYAELLKLNPHYDADFEALGSGQEVPKDHLARNPPDSVHCGAEGTGRFSASVGPIREGISYLRRVGGQPVMGPGPGNCGSVSCSYDSGIYWCNDNSFTKTLPGFGNIADGAQEILDQCSWLGDVAGQVFVNPPHDWEVKVGHDWC